MKGLIELLHWIFAFVEEWVIPLLVLAFLFPVFQLISLLSPLAAGILIFAIFCVLTIAFAYDKRRWQAIFASTVGITLLASLIGGAMAFNCVGMLFEVSVLFVLIGVPGIIISDLRKPFVTALNIEIIFSLILACAGLKVAAQPEARGLIVPAVFFSLGLAAVSLLSFNQYARERDRRNRWKNISSFASVGAIAAACLATLPVLWPGLRGFWFTLTGHDLAQEQQVMKEVGSSKMPVAGTVVERTRKLVDPKTGEVVAVKEFVEYPSKEKTGSNPVSNLYKGMNASTQSWAEPRVRKAKGEEAKTKAMKESLPDLQKMYREHWQRAIKEGEKAPISDEEWKEIGLPQMAGEK